MNTEVFRTRTAKVLASLIRPKCWRALSLGVAPSIEHLPLLRALDVDGIIDVGANRGQFTLACQIAMRQLPILAFEPIPKEADTFDAIHGRKNNILLVRCALGEIQSESIMHLSHSLDSSSLLPIGNRQTELHPQTAEEGTMTVPVQTLDDSLPLMADRREQLLKLDVQGYELNVLKGASKTLTLCKYVYAECSEVALYEGQALRPEVSGFLRTFGFLESGSFNHQFQRSELVQADYLYSRK
ncbi:FkbM family methyltransferase [Synechococcus sp. Tobar12-5m-g]|uniref:FkbM family methyltransferase n=1 Tax=unclassified Synechococcus TaxID=2626047 RepID=UPI0020CE6911|nr:MULTISPECIES: FkbM family methyltransferase [unclassified Synechococcus]MCP9773851.1 FkbM family methyltransferase [Synechococcus sp. Tobar12-5m-g]MCP9874982.1 FkbM family methyltransferase [Synechococcus sp. Cruz CV-v-12]